MKRFVFSCCCAVLFVSSPLNGDISQNPTGRLTVIDLVAPLTFREGRSWITCPDTSSDPLRRVVNCGIYGIIEGIRLEKGGVAVSMGGDQFHYPQRNGLTDTAPVKLMTLAKLHRIPVILRFQSIRGKFYVTAAML